MKRKGYTTIALPNTLIEQVELMIKEKSNGYISKPEFIKEAIRDKIRDIRELQTKVKKKE
ncbi:MAG: ribbon-helix-helix domain-containing protein [Candidatus Nanoarchaeia archaeon]|nr:ribbon-helix-helix domain-containing protein [Candidatus Nanoarchaeia archaeon]